MQCLSSKEDQGKSNNNPLALFPSLIASLSAMVRDQIVRHALRDRRSVYTMPTPMPLRSLLFDGNTNSSNGMPLGTNYFYKDSVPHQIPNPPSCCDTSARIAVTALYLQLRLPPSIRLRGSSSIHTLASPARPIPTLTNPIQPPNLFQRALSRPTSTKGSVKRTSRCQIHGLVRPPPELGLCCNMHLGQYWPVRHTKTMHVPDLVLSMLPPPSVDRSRSGLTDLSSANLFFKQSTSTSNRTADWALSRPPVSQSQPRPRLLLNHNLQDVKARAWGIEYADDDDLCGILISYFTWDHPTWRFFDEDLFLDGLVDGGSYFCSRLLLHAVMAYGSVNIHLSIDIRASMTNSVAEKLYRDLPDSSCRHRALCSRRGEEDLRV